jgi:hypothetical protein
LTSFQIATFFDEITNAGVYYNEGLPTYNSTTCVSWRESGGGAVGGSIAGGLCCLVCIGAIVFFLMKGGDKKGESTEVTAIEAAEPEQTVTPMAPQAMIPMQMQQPGMMPMNQPGMMPMQQPGMVAQPGMMQPVMMQQQPGMVAQP